MAESQAIPAHLKDRLHAIERLALFCDQTAADCIMPSVAWFSETAALLREVHTLFGSTPQTPGTIEPERWTCFHCGETFTTVGSARDHFGSEGAEPGCLIDRVALEEGGKPERGRGLLMELRKVEADNAQLRLDNENLDNEACLYQQLSSEVDRLTKGHGLRMELDYRDGEKLVLQERVAELLAALRSLRIDANRLCDRQLGGSYEADCRRAIALADAAIGTGR